jgi:hypothetical protein
MTSHPGSHQLYHDTDVLFAMKLFEPIMFVALQFLYPEVGCSRLFVSEFPESFHIYGVTFQKTSFEADDLFAVKHVCLSLVSSCAILRYCLQAVMATI